MPSTSARTRTVDLVVRLRCARCGTVLEVRATWGGPRGGQLHVHPLPEDAAMLPLLTAQHVGPFALAGARAPRPEEQPGGAMPSGGGAQDRGPGLPGGPGAP